MNHIIKPEEYELREARNVIDAVLQTAGTMLEKEDDIEVGLAWNNRFEAAVLDTGQISLRFNTNENGWQEELKAVAAQGFAQSWFMENVDPELHWQEILMLGHSLKFAEQITDWRPELNEREEVGERWELLKEELSQELSTTATEMVRYGFSLSYYIAEELLEENDLEDFTGMTRSDVIEAGDAVFGDPG